MGKKLKSALTLTIFGLAAAIAVWTIAEKPDTSYADDTADNIMTYEEAWLANDGEKIAAAIVNELPEMVSDFNALSEEDKAPCGGEHWNATGIEYYMFVQMLGLDDIGLYVDFDGNNGYAVFMRSDIIYELVVEGDLDYMREANCTVYSEVTGGFFYENSDGEIVKFGAPDIDGLRVL